MKELTHTWRKLQAIVPVIAIHAEQQYEQAIEAMEVFLDIVGEDETYPLYALLDTLLPSKQQIQHKKSIKGRLFVNQT